MTEPNLRTATGYRRVCITGAAGNIGTVLREGLRGAYPVLRLTDIRPMPPAGPGEEVEQADILDLRAMERVMAEVDAVVHLGGSPDGRDWDTIQRLNVNGFRTVVEAARRQGVRRVVFASSNHAMGMTPIDGGYDTALPPRPDSYYGVSKAFGEAFLRYYHDQYGLEAVCLRIGSFQPEPQDQRQLMSWLSHRDCVQLVFRALEQRAAPYLIAMGFSANTRLPGHDPAWARIGYAPQDDAETHKEALRARGIDVDGPREFDRLGGAYTLPDFDRNDD